jgi:hypothetical protein
MVVLTLLVSDRQLARVRAATPSSHQLLAAASPVSARSLLYERPVDALVVDPSVSATAAVPPGSARELYAIGAEFPYLPVVFYVSNPIKALSMIAHFPTRERCEALVVGIDDEPCSVANAIESVVKSTVVSQLLRRVLPVSANPPVALLRAIRHLFLHPKLFRSVQDLANNAYMTRRTLDRWLVRHGIVPGAELIDLARAFLVVRLGRDGLKTRAEIYEACGLSRSYPLEGFVSRCTGSTYSALVGSTDRDVIDQFCASFSRVRQARIDDDTTLHAG